MRKVRGPSSLNQHDAMTIDKIDFVNSLFQIFNSKLDTRYMLDTVLLRIINFLDVDAGAILLNTPSQLLSCVSLVGFDEKELGETCTILELSFNPTMSWSSQNGRNPSDGELKKSPFLPMYIQLLDREGFKDWRVFQLNAFGELKGILGLFHRKDIQDGNDVAHFHDLLGQQLAFALHVDELDHKLTYSTSQIDLAYKSTIEGWVKILDFRDRGTEEHAHRVANMTVRLAEQLGVLKSELLNIQWGALLHDIGKIAIPDSIFRKPGKLNQREWEIMKMHPIRANELLSQVPFLKESLNIPFAHHEKWDGSGYPRQLKKEEIPLPARIFAIIDVWDALRSKRPYRDAWKADDAQEYIRLQAGKHFDPQIVNTFLTVLDDFSNPLPYESFDFHV